MLRELDYLWLRFTEAWTAFKEPFHSHEQFKLGKEIGKEIAFAQVRQQFDSYDPYNIDNKHFQMGYYYAVSQAKKVMQDDEDYSVGKEAWNL